MRCQTNSVAFRSAKGRSFAERKTTLPDPSLKGPIMLDKVLFLASFGNRCYWAGGVYLLLGLAMLQSLPEVTAIAQADQWSAHGAECPSGTHLCGTNCIPDDQICCGDFTSGSSTDCCCCSADENSLSTVYCQ